MKIARNILKQGFSLIELLVVVAIIGILAAIGSVGYTRYIKISQDRAHLANLIELMNGLAVTYTGFMSNQIKPTDPLYQNCYNTLYSQDPNVNNYGLISTLSTPWLQGSPGNQDCAGYLTSNFKSPYDKRDVGGINGSYVVSPCLYGPACGDSTYVNSGGESMSADLSVNNPANLSFDDGSTGKFLDSNGIPASTYIYSDNTAVTTKGKIVYADSGLESQSQYGCRIILFAACHTDNTEDDGMLIINPPCDDKNGNTWAAHNPPTPEDYFLTPWQGPLGYIIGQGNFQWTGAKIVKNQ